MILSIRLLASIEELYGLPFHRQQLCRERGGDFELGSKIQIQPSKWTLLIRFYKLSLLCIEVYILHSLPPCNMPLRKKLYPCLQWRNSLQSVITAMTPNIQNARYFKDKIGLYDLKPIRGGAIKLHVILILACYK